MKGYMVMMGPDGCYVIEQELAGPNPVYFDTREEAQAKADELNKIMFKED